MRRTYKIHGCARLKGAILVALLAGWSTSPGVVFAQERSQGTVPVNGAALFYESFGTGEPVVVVHGGPGLDHTYLLPQLADLASHHRLIFYDQRASGRSTGTADSASINPDQFVEDLERLRKSLGIKGMNLFGHSWGGLLAMHYAVKYPKNLKSLILCNTAPATSDFVGPFLKTRTERTTHDDSLTISRILASDGFARRDPAVITEFVRATFKTYFFNRSYVDSLSLNLLENTATNFLPVYTLMGRYLANYNLFPKLRAIHCRTLILHGDFDPIPADLNKKLTRYIKHSRFVLIPRCGHFPFIESRSSFLEACDSFLDGRGRQ